MPFSAVRKNFNLEKFIFASLFLHVLALLTSYILPHTITPPSQSKPIHVQFIPEEQKPPPPPNETGTIIEAPKPEKTESPITSELLANADSRFHADIIKDKAEDYSNNRTVLPKAVGAPAPIARETPKPPRKTVPKARKQALQKRPPLPESDHGIKIPPTEEVLTGAEATRNETQTAEPIDLTAMLDGFDASKYASLNTRKETFGAIDHGEAISLDTKESKYADYFTRIKHQIQQVWVYPLEAAGRGISGELTLRFTISRDGNLLGMALVEGSGSDILDYAAFKAVKSAAPYYPFPDTIQNESLPILATFVYTPSYGAPSSFYSHLHRRR